MKGLIFIAAVAALAVCYDAASVLPSYQEETIYFEESGQTYTKDYYLDGATDRNIESRNSILLYEYVPLI